MEANKTPAKADLPEIEPHPTPAGAAELIFLTALAAYLLFTRLWQLDLKPVQHDESMFAYYAYQLYLTGHYEFMPILHGPVLQWAVAAVFKIVEWVGREETDATMRLFPALSGLAMLWPLYGMRHYLGKTAAYTAIAFLAISPTLTFYSRFCRNDVPFLAAAFWIVYMGWLFSRRPRGWKIVAWFALLAYAISIKETYLIFAFLLATFAIGCLIHALVQRRPLAEEPVCREIVLAVTRHWPAIIVGLVLGFALIVAIFTSFFHGFERAEDATIREALAVWLVHWNGPWEAFEYWSGENEKRRIAGQYHFYLLHLALYELAFLIYWVSCLISQMWPRDPSRNRGRRRGLFFAWLAVSFITLHIPLVLQGEGAAGGVTYRGPLWFAPLPESFDTLLHMTRAFHVWIVVQLFIVIGITGWNHLNRGRTFHAFVDYWAAGSFLAYSYAGEKVPWVTLHIVVPLLISCGLYAQLGIERWKVRLSELKSADAREPTRGALGRMTTPALVVCCVLAAAGLIWQSFIGIRVSFVQPGAAIERLTYASSHMEFHEMVRSIAHQAHNNHEGYDTPLAFKGHVEWPLLWSLRRYGAAQWGTISPDTQAKFIIVDSSVFEQTPMPYKERYDWVRRRFRHYWQPIPLRWKQMKRLDLLIRGDESLTPTQRETTRAARMDWGRFWTGFVLRDEYMEGPRRWEHLGGFDAYFGRRRDLE